MAELGPPSRAKVITHTHTYTRSLRFLALLFFFFFCPCMAKRRMGLGDEAGVARVEK